MPEASCLAHDVLCSHSFPTLPPVNNPTPYLSLNLFISIIIDPAIILCLACCSTTILLPVVVGAGTLWVTRGVSDLTPP